MPRRCGVLQAPETCRGASQLNPPAGPAALRYGSILGLAETAKWEHGWTPKAPRRQAV